MVTSFPTFIRDALRHQSLSGYLVAIGTVGAASAVRMILNDVFATEAPFLLFFASVMATGWYGGMKPGLFATALSAVVAAKYFMSTPQGFDETSWRVMRISIFCLEGGITSLLCGQLHAARMRAEQSAAEARDLERTVEQIAEAEQRRIGQDLHDGLGQHLTGIAFLSKALQQRLAGEGRTEPADAAASINQYMNEAIRWTRDLARGLAPMDLDRLSLAESLRELASKTSRMFSVEAEYEGPERVELPDDEMALNLYRVAQEAVSNAVKHGKARHVTIDLNLASTQLVLSVVDDGIGFDPPKFTTVGTKTASGMGLLVMRYRAGVIGGVLEMVRQAAGGIEVRCVVERRNDPGWRVVDPIDAGPPLPVESQYRSFRPTPSALSVGQESAT
jgi:signal transduction histidine kinase